MGLWSYFGQAFEKQTRVRRLAVKEALFRIDTVSQQDRAVVMEALEPYLRRSGVSKRELELALRKLRREHKISEVDAHRIFDALFAM